MFRRRFLQAALSGAACACGSRLPGAAAPALPGRAPLPPIDERVLRARIDRVRALVREAGAKWAFVSSGTTSFAYLTGASVERSERLIALLVPDAGEPVIVAPSFEVDRVRRTVRVAAGIRGWEESQNPFDLVRDATQERAGAFSSNRMPNTAPRWRSGGPCPTRN